MFKEQLTLEEYQHKLNTHDWNYHYTDDHSVYLRQAQNERDLLELTINNNEFGKAFIEARAKYTSRF